MTPPSKVYFVSGHLDLSVDEFLTNYVPRLEEALKEGAMFVVGDARGADVIAQRWLKQHSAQVTVYHMFDQPRHNAGFQTVGGFVTDEGRDSYMTVISADDIAWVRPGRENSGTANNLARRKRAT